MKLFLVVFLPNEVRRGVKKDGNAQLHSVVSLPARLFGSPAVWRCCSRRPYTCVTPALLNNDNLQHNSAKGSSKRGWMEDVHRPRDEVVVSADADGRLLRLREPSEPIQAAVQRMLVRA